MLTLEQSSVNDPPSARQTDLSDSFFYHVGIFEEAFVPTEGHSDHAERIALAVALQAFVRGSGHARTRGLDTFLHTHPQSPWRAALLTNLGVYHLRSNRLFLAVETLRAAWELTRESNSHAGRGYADRAASELCLLLARVGAKEMLSVLLGELSGRRMGSAATLRVEEARLALSQAQSAPELALRCGPMALAAVGAVMALRADLDSALAGVRVTAQGTSLGSLVALSISAGIPMKAVVRPAGGIVVVPAVIHRRLNHYSAVTEITRVEGAVMLRLNDPGQPEGAVWIHQATLEGESSGFMLIPQATTLPEGWREATADELDAVVGGGFTERGDPRCWGARDRRAGRCCCGIPRYDFLLLLAQIRIDDTPIWLNSPVGPAVDFHVSYNQADDSRPSFPAASHLGHKWTFNWSSFLVLVPDSGGLNYDLYMRNGGVTRYHLERLGEPSRPELRDRSVLHIQRPSGVIELRRPTGEVEVFEPVVSSLDAHIAPSSMADAPRPTETFRLASVSDGVNVVRLTYDTDPGSPHFGCLLSVVDEIGQWLRLSYSEPADPRLITSVSAPFGRMATFQHDVETGHLQRIVDMAGIVSDFHYHTDTCGGRKDADPHFLDQMSTPYGVTSFEQYCAEENIGTRATYFRLRGVRAVGPEGDVECVEFRQDADANGPYCSDDWCVHFSDPSPLPIGLNRDGEDRNQLLCFRNSLYWGPRAFRRATTARRVIDSVHTLWSPLDARFAEITHWLHTETGLASGVAESRKKPGEYRHWYRYEHADVTAIDGASGQHSALLAEILMCAPADGRTGTRDIVYRRQYNDLGNLARIVDPVGRIVEVSYNDNGVDIAGVRRIDDVGNVIMEVRFDDYDANHRPQRFTDDSGHLTQLEYNAHGQVRRVTRGGLITTFVYDRGVGDASWGLLRSVTTPTRTTTFHYDERNLIQLVADSEGRSVSLEYDALDRIEHINHVDGSSERFSYFLRDRSGRIRTDGAGHPLVGGERTLFTDRDGMTLLTAYDSSRELVLVSRSEGLEESLSSVDHEDVYLHDGSVYDVLQTVTDGNGHMTRILADQHRTDDRPTLVVRPDGSTTTYDYDGLGRLSSVTDGRGARRALRYHLDGRLATVTASDGSQRAYEFDPFVPRLVATLSNAWSSELTVDQRFEYTPSGTNGAGLLRSVTLPRVSFASALRYEYDDLDRLVGRWSGLTGVSKIVAYDDLGRLDHVSGDFALTQLRYPESRLTALPSSVRQRSRNLTDGWNLGETELRYAPHDLRLVNWETRAPSGVMDQRAMSYSHAGRLQSESSSVFGTWRSFSYDAVARLAVAEDWHQVKMPSRQDRRAFVHVGSSAYRYDWNSNLTSETRHALRDRSSRLVPVSVSRFSYDEGDKLIGSMLYRLADTPQVTRFGYDAEGQLRTDGRLFYAWNAFGELTGVGTEDSASPNFIRDASGCIAAIHDGTGERRLVWEGLTVVLELDTSGNILRRLSGEGFRDERAGRTFFYQRDARGSVVGLLDEGGQPVKRWSYDPWGVRSVVWTAEGADDIDPPIGFCGYYHHPETGLYLTPTRAYSPALRRWLSRDPIGYAGGDTNLFAYVGGDPVNEFDESGLQNFSSGMVNENLLMIPSTATFIDMIEDAAAWAIIEHALPSSRPHSASEVDAAESELHSFRVNHLESEANQCRYVQAEHYLVARRETAHSHLMGAFIAGGAAPLWEILKYPMHWAGVRGAENEHRPSFPRPLNNWVWAIAGFVAGLHDR